MPDVKSKQWRGNLDLEDDSCRTIRTQSFHAAMPFFAQASAASSIYWPFVVLIVCLISIIILITKLRVHAFFALVMAAMLAGLLTNVNGLSDEKLRKAWDAPAKSQWVQAVELTATELGNTAGKIGIVIALASVIGLCLMASGAADKVVRRFISLFGEKRAGAAILVSGYVLSIPIFFDTFFMLLLPLAVAMHLRTGKDYMLYIMAICCGGVVTHSLVAPHPGPLAMAEYLKLDLGLTIVVGLVAGIVPVCCSWMTVKWLGRSLSIPLRETPGLSIASLRASAERPESELPSFTWSILPVLLPIALISISSIFIAIQGKGFETSNISNASSLLSKLKTPSDPVSQDLVANFTPANRAKLQEANATQADAPILSLIVGELNDAIRKRDLSNPNRFANITLRPETAQLRASLPQADNLVRLNRLLLEDAFPNELKQTRGMNPTLYTLGVFWGNRNVALFVGAFLSLAVLVLQKKNLSFAKIAEMIEPPFATAGTIILITSAGGAFGLMLKNAGVGQAVEALVHGKQVNLILLSWVVAAVIRIAQGSATVAMLTTASMIYPIMSGAGAALPYNPVYIFMAIGFGAMMLSWMNDSGFWVVGKLSGFSEKETLKTWTVVVSVNSAAGLIVTLLGSILLPMR